MRLSYPESVCLEKKKQILISGNGGAVSQDTKNNGCAVGDPRLVPLLKNRRGKPRRSCDSSQQADRVGLTKTHGSTFVQRALSLCCNKKQQEDAPLSGSSFARQDCRCTLAQRCNNVASPNYGRKYQRRSSELAFRKYGFAPLMGADILVRVRVLVSGTIICSKSSD